MEAFGGSAYYGNNLQIHLEDSLNSMIFFPQYGMESKCENCVIMVNGLAS